ncbi:MAG: methylmalonyl-CoA mutase small subunit [Clostridiales bacterium]|nr:methylmalonyl-CoA mutase small subunit [Clostridiales bacterium]
MAENKEKLFDQFPAVSTEEWRAKVDVDLKGVPFEKKLVWRTNEGFNVQPMYRLEDIADLKTTDSLPGEYPYVRGTRDNNNWLTRQEIIAANPQEANATALEVLTKGVNSIAFNVKDPSLETLETLLNAIDLQAVEINFTCCPGKAIELAANLVKYLKANNATEYFKGSIDFNPLKRSLKHGSGIPADIVAQAKTLIATVTDVPGLRVLSVNSVMLNNAGAYIFQELGYALSWGAQWLTSLTDAGLDIDTVACRVKFNMGISSNYFMELAKFRAARMLWAQIVKQYAPKCDCACKMVVHAATSRFNQTIYDAHVNLLRSQTESMSAALAGVDSITTTPFDTPYKTPDSFSERIARNQQFLLKEESHLDKVVDPAGGSYYVETLTVSLANEAWKLFLDIEDKGGFFSSVDNGDIQKTVNASNKKRHTDMARRKEILLGTNQYPNFNEMAAEKIEKASGKCGCGCNHEDNFNEEHALDMSRQASDFEELRLATEHAANRPKVFMLTIGNLAMRLARAQFSSNFFGCAGYQIIDNIGFETVNDGVKAAIEAQADVIVLCSSDDEYATFAPEAFKLIDGKAEFVVAGAPACTEELQAQGITNFIHVRSNVLETLQAFNAKLLK